MKIRLARLVALSALACLAACGGGGSAGDPYETGLAAAKKGDHAEAIVAYDTALGGLAPDAAEFGEIQLARVESMVHVDPQEAASQFLELTEAHAAAFGDDDYLRVFEWLFEAKQFERAGAVATEFKRRRAENADLAQRMDGRIKEAIDAGLIDQSQLEALKGLGYVGSN
jgi:hypothetical protein